MKKSEIISKIESLKALEPSADFRLKSKKNIVAYCATHQHADGFSFKPVFAPIFVKIGASVAGIGLVCVLGWYFILSPLVFPQPQSLNVSSINNEWQLNDISPYLEQIFSNDLAVKEVDSALNQLAFKDTLRQGSGVSAIEKEAQSINLDKQLPILNNQEIDDILRQLSKLR